VARLILLMVLQSCFLVSTQVFLKIGMSKVNTDTLNFIMIWSLFKNGYVWLSLLSMATASVIWFIVIKNYELSIAYPLVSISYIMMVFTSKMLFNEPITLAKLIGIAAIVIGVIVITR
jgi:uncharacterized membrane protein